MITHVTHTVTHYYAEDSYKSAPFDHAYIVDIYIATDDLGYYKVCLAVIVNGETDKATVQRVLRSLQDDLSEQWNETRGQTRPVLVADSITDTETIDWFIQDNRMHWVARNVAEFIWTGTPAEERKLVQERQLLTFLWQEQDRLLKQQ